ncbi:protein MpBK2A [Marchantia polymorpha subsp. ruderalis]|nr:hypothetical protein MARPO_0003s0221 [Marchantia polymorpha]BBN17112.1 hypothetical protein Mp_7g12080 [Marchantia polymorpha subsp. ruderalis]|eukprot:PTQ49351.1 hypothetical protein MARPO_0003s0221 [Marchantia polymorpha]
MQQIILLTIATFGVIFLDAGILHWVEYDVAPSVRKDTCPEQGCITFWEAFYFLIVTVSTVGYGDITPKTVLGQLVTIVTIVVALTILPLQIGRITTLAYRRPYGGSYSARKIVGSRFLIISGSISVQSIQNFLAEFYNPIRSEDLQAYPLRVVILAPFSPTFELKQVLSLYDDLVEFIEGSPVRQSDLERVSADKAMAFFLLADHDAPDPQVEDSAQIVRALAVHRFCRGQRHRRDMRILLEVLDPETQTSAVWDESHAGGIEVICPVKVHYKMMARSCLVRGLYTLITNLFTAEIHLKHLNKNHFLTEYFHSFDNEVYPVILPPIFYDVPFEDVVEILHATFNSTLFAIDTLVLYKGKAVRKVLLNARGYRIRPDDVGIVISNDLHTAYAISTFDSSDEDIRSRLIRNLCDYSSDDSEIRRNNEGMEVRTKSGRWRRNRANLFRGSNPVVGIESASLGSSSPSIFPKGPSFMLERQFRSVIRRVFSVKDFWDPNVVHRVGPQEIGILQGRDLEMPEVETDVDSTSYLESERVHTSLEFRFPKGISLEKAAEDLLAWPPLALNQRPHPAVLHRRADLILKNLQERTLSMVAFNTPHILVCCQAGWPTHLFYFLLELRKPGSPNPPIVILYPQIPSAKQWGSVGVFHGVFYLKGSPVYELDLMRGGVLQAGNVVILSDQGIPVDFGACGSEDSKFVKRAPTAYTSDVDNIVIAANVQRLYGRKSVELMIVEMQHAETFYYLEPQYEMSHAHFSQSDLKRNRDILNHFVLPFMEGKAISSSMLGFLLRSSFYNKNTVSVVEQLVQGGGTYNVKAPLKTGEAEMHEHDDADDIDDNILKLLAQITVPAQYADRPFSELFHGLLREQGVIALGLFRVKGTLGAPSPYVLTNPKSNWIVNPDDLVYIIT